jgi:hypothetical protein
LVPVLGTVPLEATNSAPPIDPSRPRAASGRNRNHGGCDFDLVRGHSPVRSFSSGTIAPLRRSARRRVRMRSSRSSRVARVATPSASVLAVLPGLDGFLRDRSFRTVRRAAGLLHPAAGHGVRQVSGPGDNSAQVAVAGSLPAGAYPSKRSPPRWAPDRHRRLCSRGMGVHRSGANHRRVRSTLATFPSESGRCFPGIAGMRSGVAPYLTVLTVRRVPVGSHRADRIQFTSKSMSVDVPFR